MIVAGIVRRSRALQIGAALAALALVLPAAAQAHAFLIRSDPAAGARLERAPAELTLFFSEPFVSSSERVMIRRADGRAVALAAPEARDAVVRQRLPQDLRGVIVVSWRVLADDGHISIGEFAFAVGSTAVLPAVTSSTAPTSGTQVVASWLFFIGLALALGGLASERLVWRPVARVRGAPVSVGLVLAACGAFAQLALVAGNRHGDGLVDGLRPSALVDAAGTRPGLLSIVTLGSIAVAFLAVAAHRRSWALAPLAAAVVATALRGHAGTSGKPWAVAADAVHLAGAALWLGALAHLVLVIARSPDHLGAVGDGARRYSRLALPTVLAILASGVVSAFVELRHLGDLVHTSYGQTLIAKTVLVFAALAIAGSTRLRALRGNPVVRLPLLRRLIGSEATALLGVLIAVSLLVNLAPPRSSEAASAAAALGPPPLSGPSIRLAALAGQLVVGLAAGEHELQFTVLPPGDALAKDSKLSADAVRPGKPDTDLLPRSCGEGCFTIRFALPPGTTRIRADVSAAGWQGGQVEFRVPWPLPGEDPALLRRVVDAMRRVPVLDLSERVSSGPSSAAAPASYRMSGKAYLATETFGGGAVDVRPVARSGDLTELAFAVPGSSVWYRLWVDAAFRIRREQIVDPGHLITRTFSYPRTPRPASAPASRNVKPDAGPFITAREDDDLAVGLAAKPDGHHIALTFTVIGPDGKGTNGLGIEARVVGSTAASLPVSANACGAGCYRARPSFAGAPQAVLATLRRLGRAPTVLRFPLPAAWPPVSATAIARRATRVFRQLRSVVYDERLASSARNVVNTVWTLEAPGNSSYAIRDGSDAIIIGAHRWDRDPGKPWQETPFDPLGIRQPAPFWGTAPKQASLLGSSTLGGHAVWIVTFLQPSLPAWFTLWVDKATYRPLELRMVAQAHFMHHVYRDFNKAAPLRPPAKAR